MSRRVAILGLGTRGAKWAEAFHQSGWMVGVFDPEPGAGRRLAGLKDMRREATISATVQGADWVFCCLPERLELMQMVLKRAQAEAPQDAIIAVASKMFDLEAVQNCAVRPGSVFRVDETQDGMLALDSSERNQADTKARALDGLAELAAILSLSSDVDDLSLGAESA